MITLQELVHGYSPPDTWQRFKLHHIFRVRKGFKNTGIQEGNLLSLSYGRIVEKDIDAEGGLLPESFETYQIVEPGNIVMRLTDLQNDKRSLRQGLVMKRGIITSAYDALEVSNDHDSRFWAYALLALDLAKYYYSLGGGVRQSIKFADFPNTWLGASDLPTQKRIAYFIDRETARIDQLIEKKQRLVKLLEERRSAIITAAVTKGLDPNTTMKDSGVEWLGVIPQAWKVMRFKRLITGGLANGLFKKKEFFGSGIKLLNVFDVYRKNFIVDHRSLDRVVVDETELQRYAVYSGDIFFVRSSLKLEGVGRSVCAMKIREPMVFECHIVRARPSQQIISPRFLIYFLNSIPASNRLISLANLVTMATIAQNKIMDLEVPLPSLNEQDRITAVLDRESEKTDSLEDKIADSIEKLREFRSALITAAVTGQIDVETWSKRGNTERRLESIEKEKRT